MKKLTLLLTILLSIFVAAPSVVFATAYSILIDDVSVAENFGTALFTVSVIPAIQDGDQVTVDYTTISGSALTGSDFSTTTGTLNFNNDGDTQKTITVTINDEALVEADENFFVDLFGENFTQGTGGPGSVTIGDSQGEGTITNDDQFSISVNDAMANEGFPVQFTVTLGTDVDVAVDVTYDATDGTATVADNDYTDAPGSVTFPAGSTAGATQTFTVATGNDNKVEPDETFTVTVSSAHGSYDGNDETGTGTITNDDQFSISVNDAMANEGFPVQFTVTLGTDVDVAVDVTYDATDGTATVADNDYTDAPGSVTFPAGSTAGATQTFTVATGNDNKVEPDETFTVTVSSAHGSYDGNDETGTGTITNDDQYEITIDDITVNESIGTAQFTVSLHQAVNASDSVSVDYATSDGTAIAGSDYTAMSNTLTIGAGNQTGTIDVSITDDGAVELAENFFVNLSNPSANGTIIDPQGQCTINVDDQSTITIDDITVNENAGTATFTVSLSVAADDDVTVDYTTADGTAVAPGDYTAASNTLTISAGSLTGTIDVTIIDDGNVELVENFFVNLSNSSENAAIGDPQGECTINVDEQTTITINDIAVNEDIGTATFTVSLSVVADDDVTVDYTTADGTAVAPGDYTAASNTLTISAGSLTGTIDVTIIDDGNVELAETFFIDLSSPSANATVGDPQGECEIGVEEISSITIDDITVNEDIGTATFTVSLSAVADDDVTVDYVTVNGSATAGSDYTGTSGTVTINAGNLTGTIDVTTINDTNDEGDEDFFIDLSGAGANATIGDNQGRCVITDNDYTVTFDTATIGPGPPGGTLAGSTTQEVEHGTDCTPVTVNVTPGYRFTGWTGDYTGTNNPLTVTNVTSDMTITANFIAIYTINATVTGGNGTIAPSGAVTVDYGTDQTFIFDPNTCYEVDDVVVDGISEGGEIREYTFTKVKADHTIAVQFYHYDCTITATAERGGTITPSGAVTVPCGSTQTFTISGGTNVIEELLVDGVAVPGAVGLSSYDYDFTNVKKEDDDTSPCVHYIVAKFTRPALSCMDISDVPLNAMSRSAPANIMFVLDDSGSMDWEFITDESDGLFSGEYYVFNNPGDNLYSNTQILSGADRLRWKSQWSGYNRMYYDPNVDYNHWPTLSNADPNSPRSHPMHAGNTLNLSGIYESVVSGGSTINITNAHYYVWSASESTPYLVIIDSGSIVYYGVNDAVADGGNGDNIVDYSELSLTTPPADVVTGRSYNDERQNFANWYSFYRKRELTATAAIANVINSMQGVQIGLRGINGYDSDIIQPVHKIKVGGVDETSTLLNKLYSFDNQAYGTPLRRGLRAAGRYFHQYDGHDGGIGTSPYATAADGGECQQSFAIVMTDGYYNGGSPGVGNRDIDDPAGDPDNPFDGPPYEDAFSDTLADVAMYYYENDLSTTLGPEVPENPWDDNPQQHMVTYGVSFGVFGTLDPNAYDFSTTFPTWPNPTSGDQQKIDDLWHASVNGRGFFLSASNPNELVNSLLEIMQNIEEREGSASSVSVNGDELYTKLSGGGDILMFQSSYDTENWTGDVKAYQVCTDLTGNCAGKNIGDIIKTPYVWSANEELGGLTWNTGRKIVTYNGTDAGKPFRWVDLTTDQQTSLNNDSTLLDYLRGDTSKEGVGFRERAAKLGDMVHSSPTFENGVLYAGGNDGMLHAFAAADDEPYSGAVGGRELFAYVPNLVFDNLSELAEPSYTHKYFVDLTPTVKSGVNIGTEETPDLITLLVGGLGKGGRGYYALDVTDPTAWTSETAVAGKVMWEYPKAGVTDNDMGYSYSKPAIVKSMGSSVGSNGWIVIFGNGYNSQNGHAVLYILNPQTGALIKKIDTGVGGCNGLSTPVPIDVNYDNKVDYVFAGDLRGNVWKFDLTATDYNNWEVAFNDGADPPLLFHPLFQAQGPGGTTQPITAKPDVMYHPTKHGYMVLFGTGQYLGESDISDTTAQSFYGIWDYGDDEDDEEYLGSFRRGYGQELSNQPSTVSLLAQQVIPSEPPDPNAPDFWTVTINEFQPDEYDLLLRLTTDHDIVWETVSDKNNTPSTDPLDDLSDSVDNPNHAGWYFDLPLSGERGTVDMMIRGGVLIAISFIPEDTPCGYGGDSVIHEMNAASGARLTRPQFDINGDGVIDDNDMINIGTAENPIWVVPTGMKKAGQLQPPAILIDPDRGVEIKYFSSSSGTIETVYERPPLLGISHWREFE